VAGPLAEPELTAGFHSGNAAASSRMARMPRTARARVRQELTREIKEVARRQLAEQRNLRPCRCERLPEETGMVSSIAYRYFPRRGDLFTALIVDAYDAVGAAAEEADAVVRPADVLGRWMSVTGPTRCWALAHRQEYALIFGSPVPATSRLRTRLTRLCAFCWSCCGS
jgi:hypothetical protein